MKNYQTPIVVSRMNVREPFATIEAIAAGVGFLTGLVGDDYRPYSMNAIKRDGDSVFPAISLFPFSARSDVRLLKTYTN